jgi:hypothetical protein
VALDERKYKNAKNAEQGCTFTIKLRLNAAGGKMIVPESARAGAAEKMGLRLSGCEQNLTTA